MSERNAFDIPLPDPTDTSVTAITARQVRILAALDLIGTALFEHGLMSRPAMETLESVIAGPLEILTAPPETGEDEPAAEPAGG